MSELTDAQTEAAESLLSYYGQHSESLSYGTQAAHREWWMGDAVALFRELLPEWSAFKMAEGGEAG